MDPGVFQTGCSTPKPPKTDEARSTCISSTPSAASGPRCSTLRATLLQTSASVVLKAACPLRSPGPGASQPSHSSWRRPFCSTIATEPAQLSLPRCKLVGQCVKCPWQPGGCCLPACQSTCQCHTPVSSSHTPSTAQGKGPSTKPAGGGVGEQ